MPTAVVNLNRGEHHDVYIGRPSLFGNPIKVGQRCVVCGGFHNAPAGTLVCFALYFNARVETDDAFRLAALALRGKRLGCFCAPNPCHGGIIAQWVDSQPEVQPPPEQAF